MPSSWPGFRLFALESFQNVEQRAALRLALDDARAAVLECAQGAVERVVADLALEAEGRAVRPLLNLKVFDRPAQDVAVTSASSPA